METLGEREDMVRWMARSLYNLCTEENRIPFLQMLKYLPEEIIDEIVCDIAPLLELYITRVKKKVVVEDMKVCATDIVNYLRNDLLKDKLTEIGPVP